MFDLSKAKSESDRALRELSEDDICDYCQKKKAMITDGTYVYCSEVCKQLFILDAMEALCEANRNNFIEEIRYGKE